MVGNPYTYYYKFMLQIMIQRDSKSFCFLRQDSFFEQDSLLSINLYLIYGKL